MTQEEEKMDEGEWVIYIYRFICICIAYNVILLISPPHLSKVSMAFYFGVAYSATIGGTGTLIGTGTNLTFKGLYET